MTPRTPDDRTHHRPQDRPTRGPGQTLFTFVRHWSRAAATGAPGLADQGRHVLVAEAVLTLTGRGTPTTVNAIAHELGIDQSGASRMIKNATNAGYLIMKTASADGRRREVSITPTGRSMLRKAHRWQEKIFDQLTAGWSTRRRTEFQRAMIDLVEASYTLQSAQRPSAEPGSAANPSSASSARAG